MAAYRRVYDSRHLQVIEYGLPLPFTVVSVLRKPHAVINNSKKAVEPRTHESSFVFVAVLPTEREKR